MDLENGFNAEETNAIKAYEKEISSNENIKSSINSQIVGVLNPYETEQTKTHPYATLIKYLHLHFGLEFLLILFTPVIVATIIRYTAQCYKLQCPKKPYKDDRGRSIFYEQHPLLPLYYLQQTALEAKIKRESRQTLSWYSKMWVLKTNELIDEVGGYVPYSTRHDPDQKLFLLKENRWRLVKMLLHARGLFKQNMAGFSKDKERQRDLKPKLKAKRRKSIIVKVKRTDPIFSEMNDEMITEDTDVAGGYRRSGDSSVDQGKSIQSGESHLSTESKIKTSNQEP